MSSPSSRPSVARSGKRFDDYYPQTIQVGLALCVWFGALASAAQDLWAACAVFGTLTVLLLILLAGHYRTGQPLQLPFIGPVLALLGAFVVGTVSSYDGATSRLETWIWVFSFISFYLYMNSARTPALRQTFFAGSAYVLVPLAIFGLFTRSADQTLDIHATLINSAILSGFALNWIFFLWERRRNESFTGMFTLTSVILILLLGRSLWACVSIALGFTYYYRDIIKDAYIKRNINLLSWLFVFCGLLGTLLVLKFRLWQAGGSIDNDRIGWWLAALRMVGRHPLMGVGLGGYATAYPYFRVGRSLNSLFVHSFPLQILCETGWLGAAAAGWLAWQIANRMRHEARSAGATAPTQRVLVSTLSTVVAYSLVHISMDFFINKIVFVVMLAALVRPSKDDFKIPAGRWLVVAGAVFVLLTPVWMLPWTASRQVETGIRQEADGNWSAARAAYQDALAADRTSSDACAGLARTYARDYRMNHSAIDRAYWRLYLTEAFQRRKSTRYLAELQHG